MMSIFNYIMELYGGNGAANDGKFIAEMFDILHNLIAVLERLSAVRVFLILRSFRCQRIIVETVGKESP